MTGFQKELMEGIEEIAMSRNITAEECIIQAIEMLERKED